MEPKMDRRRTLTMNWDALGDVEDDDDRFFETFDRLSAAVPLDLASSSSDEDESDFDECRISFASTVSSAHGSVASSNSFRGLGIPTPVDYNIWMSAPGSIRERRNRLFQGLGLSSDDNNSNAKWLPSFKRAVSKKAANVVDGNRNVNGSVDASPPPPPPLDDQSCKQEQISNSPSLFPVLLVKSRSEADIESLSIEKRRKQDLLGSVSKQRLTRTSSLLINNTARICPYRESVRASPKSGKGKDNGVHGSRCLTPVLSNGRFGFGAFFLIKNLDTGKEFIVKEYGEDGMWNRLSDLQTGKQLTMEEFEKCVGYSPVVKELMRRQNVTGMTDDQDKKFFSSNSYLSRSLRVSKRRGAALLKNIKGVANSMSLRHEKDKDSNSCIGNQAIQEQKEKKNSSNEWVKVRQTGKGYKELSALHLCQEIQAHQGAIWTIRFSCDGKYLASAGEDKTIHVWEAQECEILSMSEGNLTPIHPSMANSSDRPALGDATPMPSEKKKKGKGSASKRGNPIPDYVHVPETVLLLSEKPVCSFEGHLDDVLDLSWSRSQLLLSSSMDKTVRLWDLETKTCLKLFAHNDYVTCIHFNPMDDNYFISGSLDAKVRIWSIPARQVVDWTDLHEMVTAACYTPDGQGAIIGSHKGSCRMYSTEDCKLNQLHQMEIQNKKKAAKKITGFQFSPVNPAEVLVTSADSRVRILDGTDVIHKFRGFRNTSSQISASFSVDGKYVISASEDSQVYIWKSEEHRPSGNGKGRAIITTQSHEHFQCRDVSVAIPWPGTVKGDPLPVQSHTKKQSKRGGSQPTSACASPTKGDSPAANSKRLLPPLPKKKNNIEKTATPPEEELAQVARTESGIGESFNSNSSSIQSGDSPSISTASATPSLPHSSSIKPSDSPSISAASTASLSNSSSIQNDDPNSFSIRSDDSPSVSAASPPLMSNSSSIKQGDSPSISAAAPPSFSHSSTIKRGESPSISALNVSTSTWSSSWSWFDVGNHGNQNVQATAWGLVIVTATIGGEIRVYQNFGLPRRGGRQASLF